jgi:DnaJ-class molecular chaperone
MAEDPPARPEPPEDRSVCSPCRGTGRVISRKGGEAHELPCPWCEGTGRVIAEHDAQAGASRRRDVGER